MNVGLGKEHKEEVHAQEKEGVSRMQQKERKVMKEAKDHRRQKGDVHNEGKESAWACTW